MFNNLKTYAVVLKQRISPKAPFGIGLRLANAASEALLEGRSLDTFKDWLTFQGLYVFTLNGFPYGGFHHRVVKDQVYAPDWTSPDRLNYTLRLIRILAALLPDASDEASPDGPTDTGGSIEGGISTLPLSYKPWHSQKTTTDIDKVFEQSSRHLAQAVVEMDRVAQKTGKRLHLDLEPEPDGLLENAAEVVDFFERWLLPVGGDFLVEHGFPARRTEAMIREHVQVCYDTCHFAVEYEEPDGAIAQLHSAGIKIGKLQLSSALRAPIPASIADRQRLYNQLQPFAESTYLHQVIERRSDGTYYHYPDLIEALPHLIADNSGLAQEWRTHFHVPIFLQHYYALTSTQDHTEDVLRLLLKGLDCQHLEIETYTWDVLPADMKRDVLSSIQREYAWVLKTLASLT